MIGCCASEDSLPTQGIEQESSTDLLTMQVFLRLLVTSSPENEESPNDLTPISLVKCLSTQWLPSRTFLLQCCRDQIFSGSRNSLSKLQTHPNLHTALFEHLEDHNLLKLRSLDSSCPFPKATKVFGDNEPKCSKCYDRKAKT